MVALPDGPAAPTLAARRSVKLEARAANEAAGIHFASVSTVVSISAVRRDGPRRIAEVTERKAYPYQDGNAPYSYRAKHRFTFAWSGGHRIIQSLRSLDHTSDVGDERVAAALSITTFARQSRTLARVAEAKAALDRNIVALRSLDAAKRAGSSIPAEPQRRITPGGGCASHWRLPASGSATRTRRRPSAHHSGWRSAVQLHGDGELGSVLRDRPPGRLQKGQQ